MIIFYLIMNFFLYLECILYFQSFILLCWCNSQTVSPFIRFLPEPLHKWYIIYAYVIVSFSAFVLFKRECCIFVTELSVKSGRIEITFQPYLL